jgi:hypothetical protein
MTAKTRHIGDTMVKPTESLKSTIEIKKAKITNNIFLTYEVNETVGEVLNKISKESNHPIHEDLSNAFQRLRVHVATICELIEPGQVEVDVDWTEHYLLRKINVTGITIGGNNESSGVTIIAQRTLRGKKILNLIVPFVKFEDELDPYIYENELHSTVHEIIEEIHMYMEGKFGDGAQLAMSFDSEDDHELEM